MGKVLQMKKKAGKLSLDDMRSMINKSTGLNVAHDLQSDNPTAVKDWIPTGSRWLDSIICKGKMAGIPVGKVTEIAGLSASGKSFMATQIAANAQKKGFTVVKEGSLEIYREFRELAYFQNRPEEERQSRLCAYGRSELTRRRCWSLPRHRSQRRHRHCH